MNTIKSLVLLLTLVVLVACVTINVYFPSAAAERAAEEFVGDVLGEPQKDGNLFAPPEPLDETSSTLLAAAGNVLDFLLPSAEAAEPEIEINTPEINAIKARMAQRQRDSLNAYFDAGATGFGSNGLVVIRDRAAVPLSDRRNLESLVADENRDRSAVYREIAVANGHPEWESDIQQTFAKEWISNARAGWYYQDASGAWKQK